ncbi:MAG: hypothetical protein ABFD16_24055, partial [Thermoguttaceae bacterium]
YNLKADMGETTDLANTHPDLVAKAEALMQAARVEDPNWPMRDQKPPRPKAGKAKQGNVRKVSFRPATETACPGL